MGRRIDTQRLVLRQWNDADLEAFAGLHADDAVMGDLGGPMTRQESAGKLARYRQAWERFGYGRWCVTDRADRFLGYVGVNRQADDTPLGEHDDIGWRLNRDVWGKGYAVEAATAALRDVFERCDLSEVLAYTAPDNMASQRVIAKLPFERRASLDFSVPWPPVGMWHGLVWATNPGLASGMS
ncbi:MAG: GNAT family N-acetyltransferase [Pseudomonadota bacterium]